MSAFADFSTEVRQRLYDIDREVRAGGLDPAIDLIVSSLQRGGVVQAFGTGHSQAFAMEIAGRAGGLIPTHAIVLRDVVLRGTMAWVGIRPPARPAISIANAWE